MTLLETVPCDGCGYGTPDPTECEHDRNFCPECVAESRCPEYRIEGMTRRWVA